MKVLVVGSGGREHSLVWKIHQSSKVDKIYCAPGNAGIAGLADCVDISATDVTGLLEFALKEKIDFSICMEIRENYKGFGANLKRKFL